MGEACPAEEESTIDIKLNPELRKPPKSCTKAWG